jgi:hypothetical protein
LVTPVETKMIRPPDGMCFAAFYTQTRIVSNHSLLEGGMVEENFADRLGGEKANVLY